MATVALRKGAKVWIPSSGDEPFEQGEVLELEPLVVSFPSGREVSPRGADVSLANEHTEEDNTALVNLSDATLLANTRERFLNDQIYTFTGSIVTSVNPCKRLPSLYDETAMQAARDCHKRDPHPHIFDTAEAAYSTLRAGGRDQSIIVSGISGAGKTEAVKYIMRYMCWRSGGGSGRGGDLADLVMQSNPVFEALGNATTVNNPNSSRFGKFIRLRFDADGAVAGALIDTYLLEKSRLAAQQPNERNFHIFYQMLAGAPDDTLAALKLARDDRFALLGGGLVSPFAKVGIPANSSLGKSPDRVRSTTMELSKEAAAADAAADAVSVDADAGVLAQLKAEFAETTASMAALGLGVEGTAIYAGLLHLGNITFESFTPEGENQEEAGRPTEAGAAALDLAAEILGIAPLRHILTKRTVQSGGARRSTYDVALSMEKAVKTRDALVKKLYEGLFRRTVDQINDVLKPAPLGAGAPAHRSIGLLDVFGFEIFERNGFEQLMVNLANEKLQRFFLDAIFRREQEEYAREKLPWIPIVDVPDNSECISTIEAKPHGVLPLLDEQCRLGERGTDGALCELLNAKNPACVAAIAALGQKGKTLFRARERFTIKHFVQPVTYTAAQFVERNSDTFFGDLSRAIHNSSNALVKALIPEDEVQTVQEVILHGVGKSYGTVAERFVSDLKGLLTELGETDAGFVRCIKPNTTLTPASFDGPMVLHQLRTCGMVQAVKMMMSMYGARLAYGDIILGWAGAIGGATWLPDVLGGLEPRAAVEQICKAFDVSASEYAFGETRLFFRAGQAVGLSAFCKAPLSAQDAICRAVLLKWKLPMLQREQAVARGVARWVRAARTKLHGASKALAAEARYVSATATAAGAVTSSMVVDASDEAKVEEMREAYVAGLARAYRPLRRAYAVGLVQARAQTRIAKQWRAFATRRKYVVEMAARNKRAATLLQAAERRRKQQTLLEAQRAAALVLQKMARGAKGRKDYETEFNEYRQRVTPYVIKIQTAWRATAPRRYLRAALAAALLLQSQWRMVRVWLLHKRLQEAVAFLRKGGLLQKYKFNPKIGEFLQDRHMRYVKLSEDLSTLMWQRPDEASNEEMGKSVKNPKSSKEPSPLLPMAAQSSAVLTKSQKEKSVMWDQITAVTDGAKTGLMKQMNRRVERKTGAGANPIHGVMHALFPALRPQDLQTSCAFSIITKDRTLDFVCQTRQQRDQWLSNMQLVLVNKATLDEEIKGGSIKGGKSATAKMMGRTDVAEEMRTMSLHVNALRKKVDVSRTRFGRSTSRLGGSSSLLGSSRSSPRKLSKGGSRYLALGKPPPKVLATVQSFTEDEIETLPEAKLKQIITQAGLTHVDCTDHDELMLRAIEARAMSDADAPSNPRYSYHAGE